MGNGSPGNGESGRDRCLGAGCGQAAEKLFQGTWGAKLGFYPGEQLPLPTGSSPSEGEDRVPSADIASVSKLSVVVAVVGNSLPTPHSLLLCKAPRSPRTDLVVNPFPRPQEDPAGALLVTTHV